MVFSFESMDNGVGGEGRFQEETMKGLKWVWDLPKRFGLERESCMQSNPRPALVRNEFVFVQFV